MTFSVQVCNMLMMDNLFSSLSLFFKVFDCSGTEIVATYEN